MYEDNSIWFWRFVWQSGDSSKAITRFASILQIESGGVQAGGGGTRLVYNLQLALGDRELLQSLNYESQSGYSE